MSRGGKREGAGRKSGIPNARTVARRELAESVLTGDVTPLEVILADMRFHHHRAEDEAGKGDCANWSFVAEERLRAREAAKDAAPFIHPKLTATDHKGNLGNPIQVVIAGSDRGLL
jgi:hypothetical protein